MVYTNSEPLMLILRSNHPKEENCTLQHYWLHKFTLHIGGWWGPLQRGGCRARAGFWTRGVFIPPPYLPPFSGVVQVHSLDRRFGNRTYVLGIFFPMRAGRGLLMRTWSRVSDEFSCTTKNLSSLGSQNDSIHKYVYTILWKVMACMP
jgi:hypothetical protein